VRIVFGQRGLIPSPSLEALSARLDDGFSRRDGLLAALTGRVDDAHGRCDNLQSGADRAWDSAAGDLAELRAMVDHVRGESRTLKTSQIQMNSNSLLFMTLNINSN